MWTKGESFGLSEAVVEYFGDGAAGAVATAEQTRKGTVTTIPLVATIASASGVPPSSSPPPSDDAMEGGGGVNADCAGGVAAAEGGREKAEPSAWMSSSGEVGGGGGGEASDGDDSGGEFGGEGAGESGGAGGLMSELPELERLRIEVRMVRFILVAPETSLVSSADPFDAVVVVIARVVSLGLTHCFLYM